MNKRERQEFDGWIKSIRREYSELNDIVNKQSIYLQEDYEMICELNNQIQELKDELQAVKLIQIIQIKQKRKQNV